jgi:glycosyltransferase involved in cell wall biosynthesis
MNSNDPPPTIEHSAVSVVIPTLGRASLRAALDSCWAQVDVELEVIVVADVADSSPIEAMIESSRVPRARLLTTGGGRGGSFARALGTEAGLGRWVAYLDDDDRWLPCKLKVQTDYARRLATPSAIGARTVSVDVGTNRVSAGLPRDVYDGSMPLSRWLFRRRRLGVHRNLIHTSTLLVESCVARHVNWNKELRRHQDWDFLLRLEAVEGVVIRQLPQVLVQTSAGSPSSISGSDDWEASLSWAQAFIDSWDEKTYADFVCGQALRYAIQARDRAGILAALRALRRSPSARSAALAASGLLRRDQLNRLMHRGEIGAHV